MPILSFTTKYIFRQAITTKYIGATNHRGSRIKASADAGTITIPWNHELDVTENHQAAARAFAQKWGWRGRWVGGVTKTGYVFVNFGAKCDAFRIGGGS